MRASSASTLTDSEYMYLEQQQHDSNGSTATEPNSRSSKSRNADSRWSFPVHIQAELTVLHFNALCSADAEIEVAGVMQQCAKSPCVRPSAEGASEWRAWYKESAESALKGAVMQIWRSAS